jgi:hypothetical protein
VSFPAADDDGFGPEDVVRQANVSRETLGRILAYLTVLDEWRDRINLIGPGEGRHLWRRHVLDSLQLLDQIGEGDKTSDKPVSRRQDSRSDSLFSSSIRGVGVPISVWPRRYSRL